MKKLLVLSLLSTLTLTLSACGKSAAESAIEGIRLTPTPVVDPAQPPAAVRWNGTGSLKMTGSPEMACASVNVEILESAAGFELRKFTYDCSGMTSEMSEIRLEYRGAELYLGADKVGQKQDNVVDFTLRDPSGASLGFRFKNEGGVLQTVHTMRANGFEQTLTASLKQ
jgi:hypothetical protein